MVQVPVQEIRDEVVSLVRESAEETRTGSSQSAVSMLIEAQCLLAELIENELNKIEPLPSLAPSDDPEAGLHVLGELL
jgi:hypothetical protein